MEVDEEAVEEVVAAEVIMEVEDGGGGIKRCLPGVGGMEHRLCVLSSLNSRLLLCVLQKMEQIIKCVITDAQLCRPQISYELRKGWDLFKYSTVQYL